MNKMYLSIQAVPHISFLLCIAAVAVPALWSQGPLGHIMPSSALAASAAIIAAAPFGNTPAPHRNTNDKIFQTVKAPQLPNQSVLRGFLVYSLNNAEFQGAR